MYEVGPLKTTFDYAIHIAMHNQKRIVRLGWNGKGMWVFWMPECEISLIQLEQMLVLPCHEICHGRLIKIAEERGLIKFPGKFAIKCTDDSIQVGWAPSQADMCANDWIVLND